MIDPYMAVALQTSVHHVTKRDEVKKNLTHIGNMIDLAVHMCSIELPVKLIALSEGVIQGFVDEIMDMDQPSYAKIMAADIPGWETDMLGEKARQHGVYIIAQLKSKMPEFPDRFFNTVFIIDPQGEVIHQQRKNVLLFVEHCTTPHDVYDEWVALYGDSLESFFPVAKTEIGNIGGTVGVEGAFPESYRAFAMNGAEILYRGALPEPWVSREIYEVQNRARAMDNTCYMLAPNGGSLIMPGPDGQSTVVDGGLGGRSSIVSYNGDVLASSTESGNGYIAAEVNIEALRHYRETAHIQNWIPFLRTELYSKLYEKSIWPKNQPPMDLAGTNKLFRKILDDLYERGVYTKKSKN